MLAVTVLIDKVVLAPAGLLDYKLKKKVFLKVF